MKSFAIAAVLLPLSFAAAYAANSGTPEQMQACKARQPVLAQQLEQSKNEDLTKRLIEADLRRASREETEGDGDECLEALDHAAKLLAGDR